MAKERLSKLQKWILIRCYNNSKKRRRYGLDFDENGNPKRDEEGNLIRIKYEMIGMWRQQIFNYFRDPDEPKLYWIRKRDFDSKEYNKMNVTITRSIRTLLKNGYIECEACMKILFLFMILNWQRL